MPGDKRLKTGRWKRTRQRILERDGWTCQVGLPGCQRHATTVDHIAPRMLGGADDPDNLRAACVSCNSRLGNRHHPNHKNRSGRSRAW